MREPAENSTIVGQEGGRLFLQGEWWVNDMGYSYAERAAFVVTGASQRQSGGGTVTACTVQWVCGKSLATGSAVVRVGDCDKPIAPAEATEFLRGAPDPGAPPTAKAALMGLAPEPNPLLTVDWTRANPALRAEINKHVDRWQAATADPARPGWHWLTPDANSDLQRTPIYWTGERWLNNPNARVPIAIYPEAIGKIGDRIPSPAALVALSEMMASARPVRDGDGTIMEFAVGVAEHDALIEAMWPKQEKPGAQAT